jgi:hypothetical protein
MSDDSEDSIFQKNINVPSPSTSLIAISLTCSRSCDFNFFSLFIFRKNKKEKILENNGREFVRMRFESELKNLPFSPLFSLSFLFLLAKGAGRFTFDR